MTSVVVWVGVDSHGPASAYVATDSRISWRKEAWDHGRKTFASARFPDVAGYWGDVLFPVVALSQFFTNLDLGAIVRDGATSDLRFSALEQAMRTSLAAVPASQQRAFTVVYASRDDQGMASRFGIRTLSWQPAGGWTRRTVHIPTSSSAVRLGGSGAGVTEVHLKRWNESTEGGTSRAVYSAFVDGLLAGDDPYSGGAPQLVGLYRIGSGRSFGTVLGRRRFLHGAAVHAAAVGDEVEWRNELFERVTPTTRKRRPGAQRHARPSAD